MFFDMHFRIANGRESFKRLARHLYEINWYYGVYELGTCMWWDSPNFDFADCNSFRENRLFSPAESILKADNALRRMDSCFSPSIHLYKAEKDLVVLGIFTYYEPTQEGGPANICFAVSDNSRRNAGPWDRIVEESFRSIAISDEVECGIGCYESSEDEMTDKRLLHSLTLPSNIMPTVWCGSEQIVSPLLPNLTGTHRIYHTKGRVIGVSNKPVGEL